MTKKEKREQAEAVETLRTMLAPGDTVTTVLKKASRSGMYRHISAFVCAAGKVRNVSGLVASATGSKWHDDDSVGMGGCGMDMGFALVYSLSRALFPDGFQCIGQGDAGNRFRWCPANDHSNGDRDYTPHHHNDGGYALNQRWA